MGPRGALLGQGPRHVAPAWKGNHNHSGNGSGNSKANQEEGSRIFITNLPHDVTDEDVNVSIPPLFFNATLPFRMLKLDVCSIYGRLNPFL